MGARRIEVSRHGVTRGMPTSEAACGSLARARAFGMLDDAAAIVIMVIRLRRLGKSAIAVPAGDCADYG